MFKSKKLFFLSSVLLLVLLIGITQKASASAEVGFLIDPAYDNNGRDAMTATNRLTSQNAYFYVDDAYWAKLDSQSRVAVDLNISALADEFDKTIYPKMREIYGLEWSPGIDNDPKIYILLADIRKDAGGYFNPNDEYFKNQVKNSRSNEKEILYLNINSLGKSIIKSFLAHEFQHMINWHQKKKLSGADEEIWLNEGLSEYSATLLGYDNNYYGSNLESRVKNFLQNSSDSLTEWRNLSEDYASVNLFMQFLVDNYGKDILKFIVSSPKIGIAAIRDGLRQTNSTENFHAVFTNWVIANYLNNQSFFGGKYAYSNPNLTYGNLHVASTTFYTIYSNVVVESAEYTKDWSGKWYQFFSSPTLRLPDQTLKISFVSDDSGAIFSVPYILKNTNGTASIGYFNLNSAQKGTIYINNFGTSVDSAIIMPISERKTFGFTEIEAPVRFSYSAKLVSSQQPVLKSVVPNISVTCGGASVTIIGENFEQNLSVNFGGAPAAEIKVINPGTIIAKAPSLEPGIVDITVTNPNSQSAVLTNAFTYFPSVKNGALIRAQGDYKVYVINGKYKRWIQAAEIFKFYPHFGWNSIEIVTPAARDYFQDSFLVRAEGDYKVYEINGDRTKHHLEMTAEQFSISGRKWDMVYVINKKERDFYKTDAAVLFR
ncbi:IPT/TIG domain-containing protein [Patescibacteria group bacterium]|nr:IPT/TIG domain-containing protein [Patescibacteria group bacterium]MBU4000192.1 IPT/TIG domain-containing protein [Patescibacteria group bacterium]MBU4057131.1 IPT/TIG domain-containing protein [Patescibacteria group bacterium]MBU4369072.1 IPT/TIG domain-containing protein [Patescibacteria group bacterium]